MNIVVAHPSAEARRQLCAPLEQYGYDVIEVADPEQALASCRKSRPEVVLVHEDAVLDRGALWLVDELKGDAEAFTTAVILVAGQGIAIPTVQEQLRRGAQDVLLEPVVPVELLARVRSAARTKNLQEELVGQSRRLETMLHQDPLTGLFNRRYVLSRLAGLVSGARRHGRPLSVAVIDVDHFKRVNDIHGHDAGDLALVEVRSRCVTGYGPRTSSGALEARSSSRCRPTPTSVRRPPSRMGDLGRRGEPRHAHQTGRSSAL